MGALTKFMWLLIVVFLAGCKELQTSEPNLTIDSNVKNESNITKFISDKYGFSFVYPADWEQVARDLPERWAMVDADKNTILFIVNKARSDDLMQLGRSQALRDLYDEYDISNVKQEDLVSVIKIVKLEEFSNLQWYTSVSYTHLTLPTILRV